MLESLRSVDPSVLGAYRLLGRLGAGGMGTVYLAEAPGGGRVAVKCVRPEFAAEPEFRGRFQREIERARQVPAFCTAEVLDADVRGELPYLVTEFVDGPALSRVVRADGPMRPGNLHALALGVAGALTAIHGAGVVHRDLKPGNVLLALGSPKVIDFGIARAFEEGTRHTHTGQMIGTVEYMAPERFDGRARDAGAPADVFAWGAVIAYAATGRSPFGSGSPTATAARILTGEPDLGSLSGPLRDLVARALSKEPADRPSAAQLVQGLLVTPGAPGVPASDTDREGAARVLQQAVHDGHLGLDEYDGRVRQAFGARTHRTLGNAVADLPQEDRVAVPPEHRPPIRYGPIERGLRASGRGLGRAALFCAPAGVLGFAAAWVVPDYTPGVVGVTLLASGVRSIIRAERRRYNK
ncbi:protein kinase [Actinoplanes sp. NPDC051494]|uniref:protein kinase domain-containing protein n=1 Tax=Actinoplanes sp. NPDC051494 TaxID=3363907 RepID=UPI0037A495DA